MTEPVIAFGQPLPDLHQIDDAEFLRAIDWRKGADRKLTRAAAAGDVTQFARSLCRQLREATRREELLTPLLPMRPGWPGGGNNGDGRPTMPLAELLPCITTLVREARELGDETLVGMWRSTLAAAIELSLANGWPPANALSTRAEGLTVSQLVGFAVLPWVAALVFGDVVGAGRLRKAARSRLHAELLERTDDDGVPQDKVLDRLPEWFACLVCAANWGEIHDRPLWNAQTLERFAQLTRIMATFCDRRASLGITGRHAGGAADVSESGSRLPPAMLASAARLAGWKRRRPAARLAHGLTNGAAKRRPDLGNTRRPLRDRGRLPSIQSDASRVACLRTDWSIDADVLVLAHGRPVPGLRLSIFGLPLMSGPWDIEVRVGNEPLPLAESWHCVCWASDDDGDYLELQQRLADGIRIERQILLAREDRLLVLADAVSGAGERPIEYVSRLPLADDVSGAMDRETREIALTCGTLAARAFPLALPDDRVLSTPGAFRVAGHALELRQTSRGGLYAPLVFDWHPRRRRGYADWRTLTVAEDGRRLTPAEAWGHRLRVADQQIVIYRSLSETRPLRTFLGQHTANETLMARFDSDGEVEPYVMVE